MNNFEELNRSRYAQMQSSIFNKTGNAIVSNTGLPPSKLNLTGKFSSLEDSVRIIESDAHMLTQAARESHRVVDQMRKVVAEKELNECRLKCTEEIRKYERVVSYGVAENQKRNEQMWGRCKVLNSSTEDLRNAITQLHNRINKLENVLGYYNGAEIVSNY